jgi:hypothetical protein
MGGGRSPESIKYLENGRPDLIFLGSVFRVWMELKSNQSTASDEKTEMAMTVTRRATT